MIDDSYTLPFYAAAFAVCLMLEAFDAAVFAMAVRRLPLLLIVCRRLSMFFRRYAVACRCSLLICYAIFRHSDAAI